MVLTFNPSTQEGEAGRSVGSGLQSKFQESQGHTEKVCLKSLSPTKKKKKEVGEAVVASAVAAVNKARSGT